MTSNANAQDTTGTKPTPPPGFGMAVSGTSVEVVGWEEKCRDLETSTGLCTITVHYQTDVFPVYFIQGRDTLEYITQFDSATGSEAVQGVKYTLLPSGAPTYLLEMRNPIGGTFIKPMVLEVKN